MHVPAEWVAPELRTHLLQIHELEVGQLTELCTTDQLEAEHLAKHKQAGRPAVLIPA